MQVRCACRRKKERWPCSLVRQQLQDSDLPAEIDGSSAVQLLGCDSKCHQLKVHKQLCQRLCSLLCLTGCASQTWNVVSVHRRVVQATVQQRAFPISPNWGLEAAVHPCSALTATAEQRSYYALQHACCWDSVVCKTGSALVGMLIGLGAQNEKRQKTELSRKEPEAPASASSSSMSPLLQTVSVRHPGTITSKERKKASREERAAERRALALKKERAERWAAWRR